MTESAQPEVPSGEFTTYSCEVELDRALLGSVAFASFRNKVQAEHPEAFHVFLVGIEPTDKPLTFKVSGLWRPAGAEVEAKDAELEDTRLRTKERASLYVNELMRAWLEEHLDGWKRVMHGGETPGDRQDAQLVVGVAKDMLQALSAAAVEVQKRSAPVLVVHDGGRVDRVPDLTRGGGR